MHINNQLNNVRFHAPTNHHLQFVQPMISLKIYIELIILSFISSENISSNLNQNYSQLFFIMEINFLGLKPFEIFEHLRLFIKVLEAYLIIYYLFLVIDCYFEREVIQEVILVVIIFIKVQKVQYFFQMPNLLINYDCYFSQLPNQWFFFKPFQGIAIMELQSLLSHLPFNNHRIYSNNNVQSITFLHQAFLQNLPILNVLFQNFKFLLVVYLLHIDHNLYLIDNEVHIMVS